MAGFWSPMPITTAPAVAGTAIPKPIAQTIETITRDMRLDIRDSTFPPIKALEFQCGAAADQPSSPLPTAPPDIP